jgi:lipopolysaccharide transport system ATP-binding protein
MSRQQVDAKFESIAAFADIGNFIDQPVKTYSSGMQARLGFAILAHVDADIIITDEALAVGDAFFVQKCMGFIRNFLERGTFIFVSHATNDIISLCQKAIWLDHGKVCEIGKAKDVAMNYLAQNALRLSESFEAKERKTSGLDGTVAAATEATSRRIEQPRIAEIRNHKPPKKIRDRRQEFLNQTQWRNDIVIPEFGAKSTGFGSGGASIESVTFEDEEGAAFTSIVGGELVCVRINLRATRDLVSPIVGFQVIDRLGQVLFGDNTYVSTVNAPLKIRNGETFGATFSFQMPLLPVGEYAIRAAVARGSQSEASMMHVIDTALVFRSITSGTRYGLIGVPMQSIELYKGETANEDS